MERILEIAITDMISGMNLSAIALHPNDVVRVKTYLRAIFKLKGITYIDPSELRLWLENNGVNCIKPIISLVNDKNNGLYHKHIEKGLKFSYLKKKWTNDLRKSDNE